MRLKLTKRLFPKLMCLLLATGIWILIKNHIGSEGAAPKATPVDEETLQPKR